MENTDTPKIGMTAVTRLEDLYAYFDRKMRCLPGVLAASFEISANTCGPGHRANGWVEVDVCDVGALTSALEEDFPTVSFQWGFLFASAGAEDLQMAVLVIERQRQADLPPGFLKIGFLCDEEEAALVGYVEGELAGADIGLAKAVAADSARDYEAARSQLSAVRSCLFRATTAMSWRSKHLKEGLQPVGPFLAFANAISPRGQELGAEIKNVARFVRDATALCRQHFLCPGKVGASLATAPARGGGPVWYSETQARQYDQCRYFPEEIASPVNLLLDEFGCDEVIELGAGTGRFTLALLKAGARQAFFVVDSSADMLDRLRCKLRKTNRRSIGILHAGLDHLDPASRKFDAIIEHEAFFMHPNPGRLARYLAELLKPEGLLFRLERKLAEGEEISRLTDLFDREVAVGIGAPVGFVGEGISEVMDSALTHAGLASIRVALVVADRQAKTLEEVNARRQRAFPYLEHVPERVLEKAADTVLSAGFPETLRIVERYDLAVSMRKGPSGEARLRRAAELLLDAALQAAER